MNHDGNQILTPPVMHDSRIDWNYTVVMVMEASYHNKADFVISHSKSGAWVFQALILCKYCKYSRPNHDALCWDRTLAYPYGALVLGPPNFGGSRPKCLIPFTKFRASRANMYGTLPHWIFPIFETLWLIGFRLSDALEILPTSV
jgi:hypothetical protein